MVRSISKPRLRVVCSLVVLVFLAGLFPPVRPAAAAPTVAGTACANDEFDTSSLSSNWTWADPLQDSSYSLTTNPGNLRIQTDNGNHDLGDNTNAPRVAQNLSGDFDVSTKVTIDPTYPRQSAGLFIWFDEGNYFWIGRSYPNQVINIIYQGGADFSPFPSRYTGIQNATVYLRISRNVNTFAAYYSIDGTNWVKMYDDFVYPNAPASALVGLFLRDQPQGYPLLADFDYFHCSGNSAIYKTPIVFVHGWSGLLPPCNPVIPEGYFEDTDDALSAAGYHVEYAHLLTSFCHTPPLEQNIIYLRDAINQAKRDTGQPKVILITHSMGGLVARAYIEGLDYQDDVKELFTFGSPHLGITPDVMAFMANGISLGKYCDEFQPAVCDMSLTSMAIFNSKHTKPSNVVYHLISGDAGSSSRNIRGRIMSYLFHGLANDGIVPTISGNGLEGTIDRLTTDEVHVPSFGPRTYFIRDGGLSTSYTQCLKKILIDGGTTCGSISAKKLITQDISTLSEHTPFIYNTLPTGQTDTRTIAVEGGPTVFTTSWQEGTFSATLIDPNGQIINPAYAASHSNIVTYNADTTSSVYEFANAAAGIWRMAVQAIDASEQGSTYISFAASESSISFSAELDHLQYSPGNTGIINATVTGSPQAVQISAIISYANGVSETVNLSPLGNGQYQGVFTVARASGYAEVRLSANGSSAVNTPFERGTSLLFSISPIVYLPIVQH